MKTLEFKASPGFGKWKKYYPKSSISHPAKINQNLLEYLILNYTNEGENVVDPMAGSGSTGVMCALNDRNCISVELEEKFWRWMEIARENVENTPQLTPKGKIINIRGDSRKLSELLKEHEEEISSVLFSPPYKTANEGGGLNKHPPATFRGVLKNHSFKLSDNPNNIDNLPFGKADTIITSPPYAQSTSPFVRGTPLKDGDDLPTIRCLNIQDGYSESMENIGNLSIDAAIFSPPYTSAGTKADENPENYIRRAKERYELMKREGINRPEREPGRYSGSWENIGNLPFPLLDMVLFSPPYSDRSEHRVGYDYQARDIERGYKPYHGFREQYENNPENIGSLKFGTILFSPPYFSSISAETDADKRLERLEREGYLDSKEWQRPNTIKTLERNAMFSENIYSRDAGNIGNIKEFGVDVVCTSPPYDEGTGHGGGNDSIVKEKKLYLHGKESYSKNMKNIGNLKSTEEEYGVLANSVLTSPPYFDSKSDWDETSRAKKEGESVSYSDERHEEKKNIGNVHDFDEGKPLSKKHAKANGKETYLQAMETVYGECHKILKKDGLMILILKIFIRQKQLVPLTEHTVKLCESCGFTLKERLLFKLPQQSFWRVLGKKQWEAEGREYPKDLSYEHILIFKKT